MKQYLINIYSVIIAIILIPAFLTVPSVFAVESLTSLLGYSLALKLKLVSGFILAICLAVIGALMLTRKPKANPASYDSKVEFLVACVGSIVLGGIITGAIYFVFSTIVWAIEIDIAEKPLVRLCAALGQIVAAQQTFKLHKKGFFKRAAPKPNPAN